MQERKEIWDLFRIGLRSMADIFGALLFVALFHGLPFNF